MRTTTSTSPLAERLVATLPAGLPGLFNPWRDRCHHETAANGPDQRLERLSHHLDCRAEFILVGEAPGYQGCRYSGIAFTSERLLLEGAIPRIPALSGERLSTRRLPFSEPSATIVWGTLSRLGIADRTILWNAVQLHPHRPDTPWSNRTPTDRELEYGVPALHLLAAAFPTARIVAIGKKAEYLVARAGIPIAGTVRHPANGGATKFAEGLEELMRRQP
jgi:uracil-DNA glycosylase